MRNTRQMASHFAAVLEAEIIAMNEAAYIDR